MKDQGLVYDIVDFKPVKRPPPPPEPLWKRVAEQAFSLKGLVFGVTAALAIYTTAMFWPESTKDRVPTSSITAPVAVEDRATLAELSVLGTRSTLSSERLQLVLVETLPGATPREGIARLGTDARNPQRYAAGALLENGARLTEIHPDHVVLLRGGARDELWVLGHDRPMALRLPQWVRAFRAWMGAGDSDVTTVVGQSTSQPAVGSATAVGSQSIAENLLAQPVFEGSKVTGFQVGPGRDPTKFDSAGLKVGDIVVAVEGIPITRDDQWRIVQQSLSRSASVLLGIERDGQRLSLLIGSGPRDTTLSASMLRPLGRASVSERVN